jgi:hypothetical protein
MINQLTAFTLNLLKTNLSLVLIFYASGFLSFIAYYRVLGLPYIAGDLQTYAEMAGKNLLFILQTFIYLVTQPNYFIENSNALNWVGNAVYIWLAAILLLVLIYAVVKWLPTKPIIIAIRQHPYTVYVWLGLIVISVLSIFYIETLSFKAKSVLQPNNFSAFYKDKQSIPSFEKQVNKINYKKRKEIAIQLNNDTKKFV